MIPKIGLTLPKGAQLCPTCVQVKHQVEWARDDRGRRGTECIQCAETRHRQGRHRAGCRDRAALMAAGFVIALGVVYVLAHLVAWALS